MKKMSRRVFLIMTCALLLVALVFSMQAVLADGSAVGVTVTVVSAIQVRDGVAVNSNVPVIRQVSGGLVTFLAQ
ncbi:MAG: hypothetical protein L6427_01795 [Actinomycetia bacterium]|nr:hypothetical protein [Actinomycetes bacterium]